MFETQELLLQVISYQDQWFLRLILWLRSLENIICTQISLDLREKQPFDCSQCHMLQCCYLYNHGREAAIRIHTAGTIKVLEGPSIKLYIFSLVLSNSAEQTSLFYHPLLRPHPMPERNHIFFLPESKTSRDGNAGAGHAQNSPKVKGQNPDWDAHSLWNSSEVDNNKGMI